MVGYLGFSQWYLDGILCRASRLHQGVSISPNVMVGVQTFETGCFRFLAYFLDVFGGYLRARELV
ncbi:hypothetical protein AUQ43_17455 [Thalassospira sp. MCCC 1A01148]|uniref:Uncharacterized protein n=1 Tax=Thalassospira profundimaris TaxID=502049 RepID=A0A367V9W6_9PROT|nr:hypothetical protein AUQ43_17455 [Thalassospira sp. MCCC 1A01148]MBS8274297.1 hypothetical protein [Thalassospira tepidiphila]RCK22026.1 hypothetical protein TH6_10085 [Thalassospira profundimaris]HCK18008.1 hypothetical protein [Thalassospira sp.]